ncbi:45f4e5c7-97a7-4900-8efd-60396bfbfa8a [Thermothielavioides terrestris]|uniref:45f4e5c7-97a7-4900-8efd-60396bfbfa8a n=1 Tax=Thermothielavioides terrestris TaxID=2587410 RepID=A0A3S5CWI7_9PEZI|nr:45f4e5c7-97a7-4900-8efd-60396bfbfa8a [Thermothielavioides terrestris]
MSPGAAPSGGGGNIKVVVRVRPFNGRGLKDPGQKVFAFDKSYWSFDKNAPNYAGQEHLFQDLGKPLLDNAFQGYNNCIFAYGQTGSGKSYSMMGYGKDAGIIPNICQDMFRRINEMQQDKNLRCTVEVSYLEIYNERVRDLLNPANKGNLKVREHPSTGPYVEDLAKLVVGSFQEIEHLMDEGNKARTVAATNMNETSSRSHAVFTLMLTQKRFDPETKMEMEKAAKISLVDLAGSERATSTGATGARLKEGAEINRSLSTLGRVIAALADLSTGKKKKGATAQVPYRDSVLTWLLKDSLGGNSMTAMIAAISPADINYDETLSTLRYADSAKRIKNHAVINEDANARMIRELKEELALLRSKLSSGGGGGGGGVPAEEVYAEGTPLEQQIVSITQPDGSVKKVSKAEIAEQLNQSEKLLQDLNQTWEQKLAKTEEIHKEREAALEELGISIEKGYIGMSTPKKMPHLVNLSDDPLLAECLVYNLKPGLTTVGNVESNADHQANIRLNGSKILHEHCVFENAPDGTVTVTPKEGAAVMVNGKRVSEPTRLHSGYRIILGDFHIFRFNHPMEARAERAERQEQSLLRQSVTASQLQALERTPASPSPRPGHDRSLSTAISEYGDSRPDSPAPFQRNAKESDWSFARREAAPAILGMDQNFAKLTDEELNALFEDVQRARAERVNGREGDEDMESMASYPIREKYMSTGTIDNFSLDTALTMPSTPKQGETEDNKLREMREEMQSQLEKQKEEYREQLKSAEAANVEVEEIKKEKARMEETLTQLKADMQKQLEAQRREFEAKIEKLDPLKRPKASPKLSEEEIERAKVAVKHWRSRHYVRMAEAVLQHAATLKEAQIMSHELDEHVVFQFTVVDVGHMVCSSYDMVLNGLTGEGDDIALEEAPKPCIGVRVIDYKHSVVHLWSLEKLHDRVRQMRQMYQYLDQPEYAQHLSIDNPFIETCMPQYTLVGEVDVPLKAVFESRVQDFTLDVFSPHTSHAIGIIKLALEPSSARAPSNTLKFNIVMHEMVGFAEREGTELHAQLFIPGISEDGITTTQMIKDFDEGPIRFESVHSMSVPLFAPPQTTLRVAIFAKVSAMHLDKLLSWDDMRDAVPSSRGRRKGARISEAHFFTEEKHDLLARVQILELNEEGEYVPVEVMQTSELDSGTFQLHQGLQRRISIHLTHSSGDALPWDAVTAMRVGKVQLLDSAGKTPDMGSASPDIALKLASEPVFRTNANGTRSVTMAGQWDSSLHNSLLLDRVTADKYRVQMTVSWEVCSEKLAEPMKFSMDVCCQILSRSFVRQTSLFSSLWQHVRIVHSATGIFTLQMRPAPIKRVGDLWRMNSQYDYVKGEENLTAWTPRGVSLVADYIGARKRRRMMAEMAAVQTFLKRIGFRDGPDAQPEAEDADLPPPPAQHRPPPDGPSSASASSHPPPPPSFVATVVRVPKNPHVLRGGYLLVPNAEATRWVKRFVELRRPYLHVHSVVDGEEVGVVSLRNARVDAQPGILRLLDGAGGIIMIIMEGVVCMRERMAVNHMGLGSGGGSSSSAPASHNGGGGAAAEGGRGSGGIARLSERLQAGVFAVYGTDNTWLFAARSERDKMDWVGKIDQSFAMGSGSGSASGSGTASPRVAGW